MIRKFHQNQSTIEKSISPRALRQKLTRMKNPQDQSKEERHRILVIERFQISTSLFLLDESFRQSRTTHSHRASSFLNEEVSSSYEVVVSSRTTVAAVSSFVEEFALQHESQTQD
jgi:hypothetical protein